MAIKGRHFTTDKAMRADPPLKIVVSNHARANLELRSASVAEVERALTRGAVESVDEKTGHFVFQLDDDLGGLRVVVQKQGDSMIVLSAVRPEELQNAH
jgi:hypothetical protein